MDRFSRRVLVSSTNFGRHNKSLANVSQKLWTICWNTYTPVSLCLAIYLSGQKMFRTDIGKKSNTNVYVSHTHFSEEVLLRVNEQRNILHEIRKRKANWIGHILRRNCLLKQIIEGK